MTRARFRSASASTSITSPRCVMRGEGGIPILCAPRSWPSRPAPTTSPRICARTGVTSATTTSPGSPPSLTRAAQSGNGGDAGDACDCARGPRRMPAASCRRSVQELTTEGGLDVDAPSRPLAPFVAKLGAPAFRSRCSSTPILGRSKPRAHRRRRPSRSMPAPMCEAACRRTAPRGAMLSGGASSPAPTPRASWALKCMPATGSTIRQCRQRLRAIPQIVELNIGHYLDGRGDLRRAWRERAPHARAAWTKPAPSCGKATRRRR